MKTSVSVRLKQLLKENGMRQIDLSEKTGIAKSMISSYIKGTYNPSQQTLTTLARALNTNEPYLMGYDVEKEPYDSNAKKRIDLTLDDESIELLLQEYDVKYKGHKLTKEQIKKALELLSVIIK